MLEQIFPPQELDLDEVRDLLSHLSQFFIETSPDRYRPFHSCWTDYLQNVILKQDVVQRHREMASIPTEIWAAADKEYWRLHVTFHAEKGNLIGEQSNRILGDDRLLRARLDLSDYGGQLHGLWIRTQCNRMSEQEAECVVRRLLERWSSKYGEEYFSLSYLQKMELAALFRTSARKELLKEARDMYTTLYYEREDPQCLAHRAWICYQSLDEWDEARESLEICAEGFKNNGDDLGAARALMRLALILFDQGIDIPNPEEVLLTCAKEFKRLNQEHDEALARETIGIVIDAEGKWEEAIVNYDIAHRIYEKRNCVLDAARVHLNCSIARLFVEGVKGATEDLDVTGRLIERGDSGELRNYYYVNRCVIEVILGNWPMLRPLAQQIHSEEKWLLDSLRENLAICDWFDGHYDKALVEFKSLFDEFVGDAWNESDNMLNTAFILLCRKNEGDLTRATELFNKAYEASKENNYPVGMALAAEGLSRISKNENAYVDDIIFYKKYLEKLYVHCPSPFVPCYVLLGQPLD